MLKPYASFTRAELLAAKQKAEDAITWYQKDWADGGIINPTHLIPYHQAAVKAIDRELAKGFDVT